jgi:hypothetical protein
MSGPQLLLLILGIGGLLVLLCLWGSIRAARRQRLIDNLPTCKTTGVFIGLVELQGTAESEQPLRSYLAERACVHYSYSISERWSRTVTETYTDKDGKTHTRTRHESGWTTVASGGEQQQFYLQDDCGVVRVNPEGAQVEPQTIFSETCGAGAPLYYGKGPSGSVAHSDHVRAFHEQALVLHAPVYVVGQARERQDVVAPEITADKTAPLFLISTRSEKQVSRGYWWTFWLLGLLGLGLAGGTAYWLGRGASHGGTLGPGVPLFVPVGLAYLTLWLLGSAWMMYNSLVDLRQRVRQAWSNVDVQLKRRHDLIPQLVRVVEGLRDYERQVQTEVAALRRQLEITPPGEPGPDPAGCGPALRTIVERYPELRADEAFLNLQRNLGDTEQRIALARGYFNEIANHYNTRLELVPDRWLATLGALRPQNLIGATAFERAPVAVRLAQ